MFEDSPEHPCESNFSTSVFFLISKDLSNLYSVPKGKNSKKYILPPSGGPNMAPFLKYCNFRKFVEMLQIELAIFQIAHYEALGVLFTRFEVADQNSVQNVDFC